MEGITFAEQKDYIIIIVNKNVSKLKIKDFKKALIGVKGAYKNHKRTF